MMQPPDEIRCPGLGVSEGIVIGQVLRMHPGTEQVYHWKIKPAEVETELKRFRAAVALAGSQVRSIKQQAEERFGKDHAYIFDAHLLMLEDEKLTADIEHRLR